MTSGKINKALKLGQSTKYQYSEPDIKILEKVKNPHPNTNYVITLTCPEFTSICPVTGQPDFAHLIIDYIPKNHIVESKSLKLYLVSYRNHGAFHEDCTIKIVKDLQKLLDPKWIRIGGYWYPRGGIPIDIFYQSDSPPKNVWVKEQNISEYKGR
ncbi:MAG: queF [Rickettsiaceae bacterium]|jgi:7-cyano-7-deazaguanine reductase|nr:queF [Rickettsiaceae bacterium]